MKTEYKSNLKKKMLFEKQDYKYAKYMGFVKPYLKLKPPPGTNEFRQSNDSTNSRATPSNQHQRDNDPRGFRANDSTIYGQFWELIILKYFFIYILRLIR